MIKVTTMERPDGEYIYRLVWSRENGEIILLETQDDELSIYSLMADLDRYEDMITDRHATVSGVELVTRRVLTPTRILSQDDIIATIYFPEDEDREYLITSGIPLGWGEQVLRIVQFIGSSYDGFDDLLVPDEA